MVNEELMDRQLELERDMQSVGKDAYWKHVNAAIAGGMETSTKYGNKMVITVVEPMARAVQAVPEGPDTYRINLWLDGRFKAHLAQIKGHYGATLGRPVSNSLVIRRGLALLASHLAGIKSKTAMKREHAALVFGVR